MSKIEVDEITQQSGTTVTVGGGSGKTAVLDATTVTIGRCGGTVALASGASQTGFGRTGTVDWQTTVKTSTFTAASGEGYFVDTNGGAVTVNLPAGAAGAIIAIKDYRNTFDTNKVTLVQNGSDKIGGSTVNGVLETEGIAVTLVFIDSTQGWLVTDSGLQSEAPTASFIAATGGTVTTVCTNFKVHTFTGPGTFCVSATGNSAGSNTIDYLVVAGGGAGQTKNSRNPTSSQRYGNGGGGGGGVRVSPGAASGCWTASPLGASPAAALPVTATGYPVTVGAASNSPSIPQGCSTAGPGSNSSFAGSSTITANGGGGGGYGSPCTYATAGGDGGSGGGGGAGPPSDAGGSGNTPPTNPPQGQDGGLGRSSEDTAAGGGGGAGGVGAAGTSTVSPRVSNGGAGGAGVTVGITGSNVTYGGGGGGGAGYPGASGTVNAGAGGSGGGGAGGSNSPSNGTAGTVNTGGGGGGAGGNGSCGTCTGGGGGSGIVIIRYKFQ